MATPLGSAVKVPVLQNSEVSDPRVHWDFPPQHPCFSVMNCSESCEFVGEEAEMMNVTSHYMQVTGAGAAEC